MSVSAGARILVVDDDDAIRKFLRISLEALGNSVIEARTGEQALAKAATEGPALVVLDLGLPDLDGREVVLRLRDWFEGPILILSVRSSEDEKVAALDAGADDYVVKPFGVQELLARVRALLRTRAPSEEQPPRLDLGPLMVDLAGREVAVDGRAVSLTRRGFDLLALLARHAGKVVTQRHILAGPQRAITKVDASPVNAAPDPENGRGRGAADRRHPRVGHDPWPLRPSE